MLIPDEREDLHTEGSPHSEAALAHSHSCTAPEGVQTRTHSEEVGVQAVPQFPLPVGRGPREFASLRNSHQQASFVECSPPPPPPPSPALQEDLHGAATPAPLGASVVACSAVIDLKKELELSYHRDRDALKDKVDETQQWFPLKVEVGDLLEPRFVESDTVPLPTLETTGTALVEQAAKEVSVPRCVARIFSAAVANPDFVAMLYDIFAVLTYVIDANLRDATAGYELGYRVAHSGVRKRVLAVLSGMDTGSLSRTPSAVGLEGLSLCHEGSRRAKVDRVTELRRLMRRLDCGLRTGQMEEVEKAMGVEGLTPSRMAYILDVRHVRHVPQYEADRQIASFRKRISCSMARLLFRFPLVVRDLLATPLSSCLSKAVCTAFATILKKTPLCDPKAPLFRDYVSRMVIFWTTGVPFANAAPPPITKQVRVWSAEEKQRDDASVRSGGSGTASPAARTQQRTQPNPGANATAQQTKRRSRVDSLRPQRKNRSSRSAVIKTVFCHEWCRTVKMPNPPHNAHSGSRGGFTFTQNPTQQHNLERAKKEGRGKRSMHRYRPGAGSATPRATPSYNVSPAVKRSWGKRFADTGSSGYGQRKARGQGDATQHAKPFADSVEDNMSPPGGAAVPSIVVAPTSPLSPLSHAPPLSPTAASVDTQKGPASPVAGRHHFSSFCQETGQRRSVTLLAPSPPVERHVEEEDSLRFRSLLEAQPLELPVGFDVKRADVTGLVESIAEVGDRRAPLRKRDAVPIATKAEAGGRPWPHERQHAAFGLAGHSPYFQVWASEKGVPTAPPTCERRREGKMAWLMQNSTSK